MENARGYVILRKGKVVGFSEINRYFETAIEIIRIDDLIVKSVSENGNVSYSSGG